MNLQDRSLRDILAEERHMRSLSDKVRSRYTRLLQKLAQRFLGEAFEEARRREPNVVHAWSASMWEDFFAQLDPQAEATSSAWNRDNGKEYQVLQEKLAHAQAEITALKN